MILVGLTGGIATGKTAVLKMFSDLGVKTFDADQASRDALSRGSQALKDVVRIFGPEILDSKGNLIRRELREKALFDPEKKNQLELIVHPLVKDAVDRWLKDIGYPDAKGMAVVEVPLLYELSLEGRYHLVVVVWVDKKTQAERLMERDNITEDEAYRTLLLQMDINKKAARAQVVIDNSKDLEFTRKQVERAIERLKSWARDLGLV